MGDYFLLLAFNTFLIAVFLAWYFMHKSRMKERLLLIEKGVDLSQLPDPGKFTFRFRFPWLKVGIILTAACIGLLLGIFLEVFYPFFSSVDFPPLMMFLFAGIGMIIAHFVDKPRESE